MAIYIGLDAHSATSTLVSLDEGGKILNRCRVDTSEKNLLNFVRNQNGKTKLVVEESNISQWVYALLKNEVGELVVCHPGYLGKKQGPKNDLRDAIHLANELRCGHVTPVFHEQSRMMNLRSLVGAYTDVIREITRAKNRYKALFRSEALPTAGKTIYNAPERIAELSSNTGRFVAENILAQIDHLEETKGKYLAIFKSNMGKHSELKRLDSIPGIDCVRAHVIAAIICSAGRFKNKHKLWAYAMLVKYGQDSDDKNYGLKSVQGRRELKEAFMGVTECILRGKSSLRKYYDRLRTRDLNHVDAKKALARKVAAICLSVLKHNNDYDDKLEDKRNRLEQKQT